MCTSHAAEGQSPNRARHVAKSGKSQTLRCDQEVPRDGVRACTRSRATWGGDSVCLNRVRIQSILRMCSSFRFARSSAMLSCVRSDRIAVSLEKLGAGIALCTQSVTLELIRRLLRLCGHATGLGRKKYTRAKHDHVP